MKKLLINLIYATSFAAVAGCGSTGDNNSSSQNLPAGSNQGKLLTIHNQTTLPIINGTNPNGGFDIHNNSDHLISGIKLTAVSNYPDADNSTLLDKTTAASCSTIAANSSCHVKVNIPQVSNKANSGSIAVNAKYYAKGNQEIHGLVNFQYFDAEELGDGVHVLNGVKVNSYGNEHGYATAYLYDGGKGKVYKINAIKSKGLKVVNGDFVNKTIASGQVIPVEISGVSSPDKNYIDGLTIDSSDYVGTKTLALAKATPTALAGSIQQYSEEINVEVLSQANTRASMVTSFNPRLDLSRNTSGVIYFHNNSNTTINGLNVDFGSNLAANGSSDCSGTLESGIICTVPYKITTTVSGTSTVKLSYNTGNGNAATTSVVSWYNSNPIGILTINPVITNLQFDKNESGLQSYTIRNIGGVVVNSLAVKATTINGHASGTILDDACSNKKLCAGESCVYTLAVTDSSPTDENPEASGELETVVNGSYIDDHGKAQKTLARGIIDYTALIPQSVIVSRVNPTGVASISANNKDSAERVIIYTNVGSVTATDVSGALTKSSSLISISNDSCSAKNTLLTGESCNVSLKFGPTKEDVATTIESEVTYTLLTKFGNFAHKHLAGFQYQVLPAAIEIESITATAVNNNSGNGTAELPFIFSGAKTGQKMISFKYKNTGSKSLRINKINLEAINPQLWQPVHAVAGSCLQEQTNAVNLVLEQGDECTLTFVNDIGTNPYQLSTPSINADLPIPVIEVSEVNFEKVYEIQAKTPTGDSVIHSTTNQGVVTSSVSIENDGLLTAKLVIMNSLTNGADYSNLAINSQMQNLYGVAGVIGGTGAQLDNCADNGSNLEVLRTSCNLTPDSHGVATAKAVYPLNKTLVGSSSILNN